MNKSVTYTELDERTDSLSGVLALGKEESSSIDSSTELKTILREIRQNNISELGELIGNKIEYLSINYNESIGAIEIKIKKTSMKKMSKFEHSTSFYYGIFGEIFDKFTMNHLQEIKDIYFIRFNKTIPVNDIIASTAGSYNLVPILDNIINVYI